MARECVVCGKATEVGYQYTRRGLAKAKGGVGIKVTGKTKRKFHPNLQSVRAMLDGVVRRVRVCTRCLKAGKVHKPVKRNRFQPNAPASAGPAESADAATT
jgi:large subunit ribosomal protein L28